MGGQSRHFSWADDLSWIVGRLGHEEIEGGFWTLEFGTRDAPHGGRVVLGNPPALAQARPHTLVRVEGRAQPDRMGFWMAGTVYDVTAVQEVPHGNDGDEANP